MSQSESLLIELFTEELPPKSLKQLGEAFANNIVKKLSSLGLVSDPPHYTSFASPRRLAVLINQVLVKASDVTVKEKLLPVTVALQADGQPSAPLIKKLLSLGISDFSVADLERLGEGKNEALYIQVHKTGASLADGLQEALDFSIGLLPIAKMMRYQVHPGTENAVNAQFVRPAHGLIALHGTRLVPLKAFGLQSKRSTLGHRFLSKGFIEIDHADHYEELLRSQGKVIAHYQKRLDILKTQLNTQANEHTVLMPEPLLEEVNALLEWPAVYACTFDKAFLEIPQECLILTMQTHQKYFALTTADGQLVNRFLVASNIETPTPAAIISGNERVIRPRLSDAKFFYQQDRKTPLIDRFAQLEKVVYHHKLGNQRDRVYRVAEIARYLAAQLSAHYADSEATSLEFSERSSRAALLMKADLLTDMVSEFPELQGIMGHYYALHDGENSEVAAACAEHYLPRFAGDQLPTTRVGLTLALADKLETVVGIWGIGLAPTGEKDPYALRRHALGICRLIVENNLPLNLKEILDFCQQQFASLTLSHPTTHDEILTFIKERLKSLVKESHGIVFSTEEIEAVFANINGQFNEVPRKLLAVHEFQKLPEAAILAQANKRLNNILKKNAMGQFRPMDTARLELPAEKLLYASLQDLDPLLNAAFEAQDFYSSLKLLTAVSVPVESFFADVMVMDPDEDKRHNRLALLHHLYQKMNQVADLSQLAS